MVPTDLPKGRGAVAHALFVLRLSLIKAKYDPDDFFRFHQSIQGRDARA